MRRQTSLTRLTSPQRFLGAVFVAGGAVAALGDSLNARWLLVPGLAIAVGAALAQIPLAFWQGLAERSLEKTQTSDLLLVPVGVIGNIKPTSIKVDAAAQDILDGGPVPEYVLRNIDAELQGAVAAALAGDPNPWIVVVYGQSKVGKSRSLFEALSRCAQAETLELVAPVDGAALIALPADALPGRKTPAVLWLDDLEPILNDGVMFATLQKWRNGGKNRIVAATYGGKGGDSVAGSATAGLRTSADAVLAHAKQVLLVETTADEIAPIVDQLNEEEQAAIEEHGLAAFLVAGPQLELKLNTGFHVAGEERCPEGVAVVHAAVDWARCGRTDSIDRKTLRKFWVSYLSSGTSATDEGFEKGLEWACRPVVGTIALLHRTGSWKAFDYVVRFVSAKADASPPRDESWVAAIDTARDTQALSVGVTAYRHDRLKDALAAFERASSSDIAAVVAMALVSKGVALGESGDPKGAIAAYDEVITRFADASESPLREQVAWALFSKGIVFGKSGDPKREIAAYDEVVARFADATESPLRELVANALVSKGIELYESGDPKGAIAAYDEVITRFADASESPLREQVAKALVNKGVALGESGDPKGAIAAYDEVITRFADVTESPLRELVVKALVNKGVVLAESGDPKRAIAAYDEVITRFADASESPLREQVAWALFSKGVALGESGDPKGAIAAYDEVITRFADVTESPLRELVAKALVNKGVVLAESGDPKREIAAYDEVITRFADASEASLRELVARAQFNKGVVLGESGDPKGAIAAYDEVITRFADASEASLREEVARALFNKGSTLYKSGDTSGAIAACDEVVTRFADVTEGPLRDIVEKARQARDIA